MQQISQKWTFDGGILAAMPAKIHRSVLVKEMIEALRPERGGLFLDGTLGTGGHAEALLDSYPGVRVFGIDRDETAIEAATGRLAPWSDRFEAAHVDFREAPGFFRGRGITRLSGVILDLGVSTTQLEDRRRGFSFQTEGPLDMRMDRRQEMTAHRLVNDLSEEELGDLIYRLGEERAARRIARAIVRARRQRPVTSTTQLSEIILRAIPTTGRTRIHPATRTFQAFRIAVNDELRDLGGSVLELVRMLEPDGRLAVISFHSLEDRAVKGAFKLAAGQCQCPRPVPESWDQNRCVVCGAEELARLLSRKPLRPTLEEIALNPRSRSAKMRVCERLSEGS